MLDIGWTELLAIAVVTIVIVGPKDLPKVLRTVGKWTAKARSITREFQNSLDDMARETELDEIKKEIESTTYNNIGNLGDIVDPTGTSERVFDLPETAATGSDGPAAEQPDAGNDVEASSTVAGTEDSAAPVETVSSNIPDPSAEEEPQRQVGS